MLKSGSGVIQQEPYNEVVATALCQHLGINYIPYTLVMQSDYPYSLCENFVAQNSEFVSANQVVKVFKKGNSTSLYNHFIESAIKLGLPNIQSDIDKMLFLDFVIANTDRHLGNFGLLRNPETLEYIAFAPIFDSGTSLWNNKPLIAITTDRDLDSKPFAKNPSDQLKLISNFNWLNPSLLEAVPNIIYQILNESPFIDKDRLTAILEAVKKRIAKLCLS